MTVTLEEVVAYVLSISTVNKRGETDDPEIIETTDSVDEKIINIMEKYNLINVNLYNLRTSPIESLYFSVIGSLKHSMLNITQQNKVIFMDRFIEKIKRDIRKTNVKDKKLLFAHINSSIISEYVLCFMAEYFIINIFVLHKNKIQLYYSSEFFDKYRNSIVLNKINDDYNPLKFQINKESKQYETLFKSTSELIQKLILHVENVFILGIKGKIEYGTEDLLIYDKNLNNHDDEIEKVKEETAQTKSSESKECKQKISVISDDVDTLTDVENIKVKNSENKEHKQKISIVSEDVHTSTEDENVFVKITKETKLTINAKTKLIDLQEYAKTLGISILKHETNKLKTRVQLIEEIKSTM